MTRFKISLILVLGLGWQAPIVPAQVYTVFNNIGTLDHVTNVVDNIVINTGTIDLLPSLTNYTLANDPISLQAFQTQQTLFYTNLGEMVGQPGFSFSYGTSSGRFPSSSFYDSGTIIDYDVPVEGLFYESFTGVLLWPPQATFAGDNAPVPSSTVVSATNIFIDGGNMTVGDAGLLQLNGQKVQLNNATLVAGSLGELDPNGTLTRGLQNDVIVGAVNYPAFAPPNGVYDIYWGTTNGASYTGNVEDLADIPVDLTELVGEDLLSSINPTILGSRNGNVEGVPVYDGPSADEFFPVSGNPLTPAPDGTLYPAGTFVPFVLTTFTINSSNSTVTNFYVNVVLVNTNFANSDITAQVGFLQGAVDNAVTNSDANAFEDIVKFSAPVLDVTTGQTVTNSIYLLDSGAASVPIIDATNCIYRNDAKPDCFEIVREEPFEWEDWLLDQSLYPVSAFLDTNLLYEAGEFKNVTAPTTNALYGVQVGRNPESPTGLFPFTETLLGSVAFDMPDLSNEPGRIEINAGTVDMSNVRLRGNGVFKLNATNYTNVPTATDFGNINCDIGNLLHSLTVSNLVPSSYHRLQGDILAWNVDFVNAQSNSIPGGTTNTSVTNTYIYHILVVDQDLRSTFTPSAINVALRGSNLVVDDQLNVIGSALFQANSITFNSSLHMSGNTPTLLTNNMPVVRNLLIGTNGSIAADNYINLGVPNTASPINPATATYSILTFTNLGAVASGPIQLQAQIFANGGTVLCTNDGGLYINAKTNLLGVGVGQGQPNSLTADSGISLNSVSIQISNSTMLAGQVGSGALTLSATSQLTDFVPGTASTNTYTTNVWTVGDGFSLPVKPTTGDLFGTKIVTVAAGNNVTVNHVWAGVDWSNNVAMGWTNNEVIGHLVLDRPVGSTNTILHFSAAGTRNAMYVDYLDLEDLSFSDYHHGLEVDPNLTIYFADANVDPSKLHQVYSNIVRVPQFAGPNSSVSVAYKGGSNVLMNAALAMSPSIDSDFDGIPNASDPYPLDNPILGPIPNPSNPSPAVFTVTNGGFLVVWTVAHGAGNGTITPANFASMGVTAGQTVNLTAVPSAGSLFYGWTLGSANGPLLLSTQPTLAYVIPATNTFLMANFVPNPYPSLAGSYNGLFYNTNAVAADSSGFVTFIATSTGLLSGRVQVGITNYPFSSQLAGSGLVAVQARNGTNTLTVTLQFDTVNLSSVVSGSVSNGTWQANLTADRAPTWTTVNPEPLVGRYTFILPGDANAAASPGGDSFGTATVDSLGRISAVFTLADSSTASQSVPISKEGLWPFYFTAPGASPQSLLGWITFSTNGGGFINFSGLVNWIKVRGMGLYYTNGFVTNAVLQGEIYVPASNASSGLNLLNPAVTLSGGNLAAPVVESVNLIGNLLYESADRHVTLIVSPAIGRVTGVYAPGGGNRTAPLGGVLLQQDQTVRGSFLGTNQSGSVLLQSQ